MNFWHCLEASFVKNSSRENPSDTVLEVEKKVIEWLEFGSRLVWVVSSKLNTVTVYRSLRDIVVLTEADTLDGGDVIPGFQMAVAKIFAE